MLHKDVSINYLSTFHRVSTNMGVFGYFCPIIMENKQNIKLNLARAVTYVMAYPEETPIVSHWNIPLDIIDSTYFNSSQWAPITSN